MPFDFSEPVPVTSYHGSQNNLNDLKMSSPVQALTQLVPEGSYEDTLPQGVPERLILTIN